MQCDLFEAFTFTGREEVARPAPPRPRLVRTVQRPESRSAARARDAELMQRLQEAHMEYNYALFDGHLKSIHIRISRRMRNRLGHYMVAGNGEPAEIAMSLRHLQHDPWDDVLHTLVHEMVHQWQDEHGHALDHGPSFRSKAIEVGIAARATRAAGSAGKPRLAARAVHRGQP